MLQVCSFQGAHATISVAKHQGGWEVRTTAAPGRHFSSVVIEPVQGRDAFLELIQPLSLKPCPGLGDGAYSPDCAMINSTGSFF
jgi:hypothetical protein